METYGHYDYENKLEPRALLGTLVERTLSYLSNLRPYAHRAQQAACDVLHTEGMDLAHAITHVATQDLPALCIQSDIWTQKVVNWMAAVSDTVRGLWGQARTYFTSRRTGLPTGQPAPDQPPTFAQLAADVQELKREMATIKSQVADLTAEMRAGFQAIAGRSQQVDDRFQQVDDRFQQVDDRFQQVDDRFQQVDDRFQQVDDRFQQVDDRFQQVDDRFQQVDDRFQQVDDRFQQVDDRFQQVDDRFQQVDENLTEIKQELHQARLHRDHIMAERRQGEKLEVQLDGYVEHNLNITWRPPYGPRPEEDILWIDTHDARQWRRLKKELNLSPDPYVRNIDWLTELQWPTQTTPRLFLACEATLTLDREHITKLVNACQQLITAGHRVVGILGYVKASTTILDEARAHDLVLLHFTEDMDPKHVTEETAGPLLTTRLRDLPPAGTALSPGTD